MIQTAVVFGFFWAALLHSAVAETPQISLNLAQLSTYTASGEPLTPTKLVNSGKSGEINMVGYNATWTKSSPFCGLECHGFGTCAKSVNPASWENILTDFSNFNEVTFTFWITLLMRTSATIIEVATSAFQSGPLICSAENPLIVVQSGSAISLGIYAASTSGTGRCVFQSATVSVGSPSLVEFNFKRTGQVTATSIYINSSLASTKYFAHAGNLWIQGSSDIAFSFGPLAASNVAWSGIFHYFAVSRGLLDHSTLNLSRRRPFVTNGIYYLTSSSRLLVNISDRFEAGLGVAAKIVSISGLSDCTILETSTDEQTFHQIVSFTNPIQSRTLRVSTAGQATCTDNALVLGMEVSLISDASISSVFTITVKLPNPTRPTAALVAFSATPDSPSILAPFEVLSSPGSLVTSARLLSLPSNGVLYNGLSTDPPISTVPIEVPFSALLSFRYISPTRTSAATGSRPSETDTLTFQYALVNSEGHESLPANYTITVGGIIVRSNATIIGRQNEALELLLPILAYSPSSNVSQFGVVITAVPSTGELLHNSTVVQQNMLPAFFATAKFTYVPPNNVHGLPGETIGQLHYYAEHPTLMLAGPPDVLSINILRVNSAPQLTIKSLRGSIGLWTAVDLSLSDPDQGSESTSYTCEMSLNSTRASVSMNDSGIAIVSGLVVSTTRIRFTAAQSSINAALSSIRVRAVLPAYVLITVTCADFDSLAYPHDLPEVTVQAVYSFSESSSAATSGDGQTINSFIENSAVLLAVVIGVPAIVIITALVLSCCRCCTPSGNDEGRTTGEGSTQSSHDQTGNVAQSIAMTQAEVEKDAVRAEVERIQLSLANYASSSGTPKRPKKTSRQHTDHPAPVFVSQVITATDARDMFGPLETRLASLEASIGAKRAVVREKRYQPSHDFDGLT